MTEQGSALTRYRRALAGRDPDVAWAAALELDYVGLLDALGLVLMLAAAGDPRYPGAAGRWLGRLALERGLRLDQVLTAAAALVVLGDRPRSPEARSALEQLVGR